MLQVELLNIGTELLMGFVINTHAAWLGQRLAGIGATLQRQTCVNDTPADILQALNETMTRADLVITTGGLGPTSDDLTLNLVIRELGLSTHMDGEILRRIEARFRNRGASMPVSVKSQAVAPDGAMVFPNENGTAPGLAIPLPDARKAKWLVMLPGPPRELCPMFENQVLPFLLKEYAGKLSVMDCRVLRVVGMGESAVEEKVAPVLKNMVGLEVGYCARSGEVDLRLVVRAADKATAQKLADQAERQARRILGDAIFGTGDETLEQAVVRLLRAKGKWLATAESCTGGYLAHRVTLVPGSSEVFREGWVTYSNQAKSSRLGVTENLIARHGAVSAEVARAMAEGALRESVSDYALGITGIAGPGGGTEEKPVGTVFIALASKTGSRCESFRFELDRETFKFIVAQTALDMLRRELLGRWNPTS